MNRSNLIRINNSKRIINNLIYMRYFTSQEREGGGGGKGKGRESIINIPQNNSNNNNNIQIDLNPPRGTRDFFPDEQRLKLWLFNKWKNTAKRYGFEEYDAPVVENEELYLRKGGEEMSQQLYNFTDKSGRRLCLRPEMTPSLARMILSKGPQVSLPLRWFSIPQCWRYERMAKGRRREHYQWNMDIWGVDTVHAEAELLSSITNCLKSMGLTEKDVIIKINSRQLIISMLKYCEVPESLHISACVIIDKLDKLPPQSVVEELISIGISQESTTKLISLLKLSTIEEFTEVLNNCDGLKDLSLLFQLLNSYGIQNWVQFDSKIVRGLAYYTGIVFECFDRQGEFRAICGGGRYDKLLSTYVHSFEGNNSSIPAVGFGFGDAVIVELLRHKNLLPNFSQLKDIDILIGTTDSDSILYDRSIKVASELREIGYHVDLMLQPKRFKSILQTANRNNVNHVIVFSLHEMNNEEGTPKAIIKSLLDGSQKIVADSEICQNIQQILKTK